MSLWRHDLFLLVTVSHMGSSSIPVSHARAFPARAPRGDRAPRKTRALLPQRSFWSRAAARISWRRGERSSLCLAPCAPRSSYWLFCCASYLRRWATSSKHAPFICALLQVSHSLFILLYNPLDCSSNCWHLQMEPGALVSDKGWVFFYFLLIYCFFFVTARATLENSARWTQAH